MQIVFNNPKKENINFETLTSAYRKLFLGTKEGQIILNDLSQKARIFIPLGSSNSSDLLYIEGMRALFFYIASYLEEKLTEETCIQDYDPFDKKH